MHHTYTDSQPRLGLRYTLQGLTQTFLSSGPQDHQLRESGGPTIFLVVLRIKSRHTNSYAYIIKK